MAWLLVCVTCKAPAPRPTEYHVDYADGVPSVEVSVGTNHLIMWLGSAIGNLCTGSRSSSCLLLNA